MSERWLDAVDEHREAIERVAEADLPLSPDVEELLRRADRENGGEGA